MFSFSFTFLLLTLFVVVFLGVAFVNGQLSGAQIEVIPHETVAIPP